MDEDGGYWWQCIFLLQRILKSLDDSPCVLWVGRVCCKMNSTQSYKYQIQVTIKLLEFDPSTVFASLLMEVWESVRGQLELPWRELAWVTMKEEKKLWLWVHFKNLHIYIAAVCQLPHGVNYGPKNQETWESALLRQPHRKVRSQVIFGLLFLSCHFELASNPWRQEAFFSGF
jgi:hypothetical protein